VVPAAEVAKVAVGLVEGSGVAGWAAVDLEVVDWVAEAMVEALVAVDWEEAARAVEARAADGSAEAEWEAEDLAAEGSGEETGTVGSAVEGLAVAGSVGADSAVAGLVAAARAVAKVEEQAAAKEAAARVARMED
jgi:hypothetical protein